MTQPYIKTSKPGKKGERICYFCRQPYPSVPIPNTLNFQPHREEKCIKEMYRAANKKLAEQGEKDKRDKEKVERKERKVWKEKLKTKNDYTKDLQTEINQIVKYIDASWPCISSRKSTGKRNAGHFYATSSQPAIRFHLFNIFNQSEHDNTYKSGNPIGYREGLLNTFGTETLAYIEGLKTHPPINLTIEDLKEKIAIARQIVKRLKKADLTYTTEERIEMRRHINKELNIYKH